MREAISQERRLQCWKMAVMKEKSCRDVCRALSIRLQSQTLRLQLKHEARMLREAGLICLRGKGVCGEVSGAVWSTRVLTA